MSTESENRSLEHEKNSYENLKLEKFAEASEATEGTEELSDEEDRTHQEKEEMEEGDGISWPTMYQLIGIAFCCFGICIGIFCIILTTAMASFEDVENSTIRWVFGTTFGVFLFSLFLCLCCIYYMGASDDSWEAENYSGMKRKFSNLITIAGLIVEFVQICSFSFNRKRQFGGYDFWVITFVAVPVEEDEDSFDIIYWIMFAIAFTPYLFFLIVRFLIFIYKMNKGESKTAALVQRVQGHFHSVLWFLVNALYLPVIGTMIAGTDCTYSKDEITLDADNSIECLEGKHIAILICSMVALIIYYPAASFAQAQTYSISDIKFKPRIVFIMLQGKFLLTIMTLYFQTRIYVYYSIVSIIYILFLILNITQKPCLVRWINQMRTIFFSMCIWASFSAGILSAWILDDEESIAPLIVLFVGWGFILILFPIFFRYWSRINQSETFKKWQLYLYKQR